MSPENLVGDLLQAALGSFARVGAPKVVAEHSALGLEGGVTLRNFQARNSLGEELVISVAEPRVRRFAVPVIAAHQTNDCGRLEVFGLAGDPTLNYGLTLALRGHRVFSIDLRWTGERAVGAQWDFGGFQKANPQWSPLGADCQDYEDLIELMRDYFNERPPYHWLGHSHGGVDGYVLAAKLPKGLLSKVVCNAGYVGFPSAADISLFPEAMKYFNPAHSPMLWHSLPKLLISASRHTKLLLNCYRSDQILPFPLPDLAQEQEFAAAGDAPEFALYEGGHAFPASVLSSSILFLETENPPSSSREEPVIWVPDNVHTVLNITAGNLRPTASFSTAATVTYFAVNGPAPFPFPDGSFDLVHYEAADEAPAHALTGALARELQRVTRKYIFLPAEAAGLAAWKALLETNGFVSTVVLFKGRATETTSSTDAGLLSDCWRSLEHAENLASGLVGAEPAKSWLLMTRGDQQPEISTARLTPTEGSLWDVEFDNFSQSGLSGFYSRSSWGRYSLNKGSRVSAKGLEPIDPAHDTPGSITLNLSVTPKSGDCLSIDVYGNESAWISVYGIDGVTGGKITLAERVSDFGPSLEIPMNRSWLPDDSGLALELLIQGHVCVRKLTYRRSEGAVPRARFAILEPGMNVIALEGPGAAAYQVVHATAKSKVPILVPLAQMPPSLRPRIIGNLIRFLRQKDEELERLAESHRSIAAARAQDLGRFEARERQLVADQTRDVRNLETRVNNSAAELAAAAQRLSLLESQLKQHARFRRKLRFFLGPYSLILRLIRVLRKPRR